jgi:hypothetical protein
MGKVIRVLWHQPVEVRAKLGTSFLSLYMEAAYVMECVMEWIMECRCGSAKWRIDGGCAVVHSGTKCDLFETKLNHYIYKLKILDVSGKYRDLKIGM